MTTRRMGVALALAGLFVLLVTLAQLLHHAPRQSGSNDASPLIFSVTAKANQRVCQPAETLFAGTRTLRLTAGAYGKPTRDLDLTVTAGGRDLARGTLAAGWREGVVRVPVGPVPATTTDGVTICLRSAGRLAFGGEETPAAEGALVAGRRRPGRIALASFRAGRPTLLGVASDVVTHYDRGNAGWLGGWTWGLMIALLLGGLAAAGAALVLPATSDRRLAPAARAAVACALAVGATWALLTPPYMVPDEISHVAYVQGLVETGELPVGRPGRPVFSARENTLLAGLHFFDVIGDESAKPAWTPSEGAAVRAANRSDASRATLDASSASNNPPLYYLAEAPVYAATRGSSMLDQLLPMRLLSVLLGGLTVLFVFLFLRELLPRSPGVWPVGAVAVALQPLFGFVTGGVNADAGMFACGAAALWLMAVVLRRGLTARRGLALGAALAAGVLTKPLFLALVPAGVLALVVAGLRLHAPWRRRAALVAAGAAAPAVPVLVYDILGDVISGHPYFPSGVQVAATAVQGATGAPRGLAATRDELGYVWQLFLPRLGFMNDRFADLPLRVTWFDGFVGRFGWLDYAFPRWATGVAVWIAIALLALATATLVRARRALRERWAELLCCALAFAGILAAIGIQQYNASISGQPGITQARYLLPALALYGALVALAARGLGRRAVPYVGVALVVLAAVHEVAAMILTITRYYA
ncbi:MAG: DUF2142 domain-containing protein [Solirubrobacteraceae bacterium]